MELSRVDAVAGLEPEQLLRAVSHGLANRLLAVRCRAELAASAARRGDSVDAELTALLLETDQTTDLARELVSAARLIFSGDGGTEELTRVIALRLPEEIDQLNELDRSTRLHSLGRGAGRPWGIARR